MDIATSKGFIFHGGKLKAYEFISALVDYESGQVEYTCKLGGKKTVLVLDECPAVYESAKAFKAQIKLDRVSIHWCDMMNMALGIWVGRHSAEEFVTLWAVEENQPIVLPAPKSNFLFRKHWDVDYIGEREFFKSRDIALMHCDLIKVDEDGVETREASIASKLKLSDEQWKAIDAIKEAMAEAEKLGVQLIFDRDNCVVKAFSTTEIKNFEFDYPDDGEVGHKHLMQKAGISIYDANCEDCELLITWKE